MKNISLKSLERKNSLIRKQWIIKLNNHKKFCRFSNFFIDGSEVICDGCYKVLLNFCIFCGSARMEEHKFYLRCSDCKSIFYKNFL